MSQSNPPSESAKRNDSNAVTTLFNFILQPHGVTVETQIQGSCLSVYFSSTQRLEQKSLVNFSRDRLERLRVKSFQIVKLYGNRIGADFPLWTEALELAPTNDYVVVSDLADVSSTPSPNASQLIDHSQDRFVHKVSSNVSSSKQQTVREAKSRPVSKKLSQASLTLLLVILFAILFGIIITANASHTKDISLVSLGVIFLTGLTTGGLSCMAVQGGLLASSIASQVEQDIQQTAASDSTRKTLKQSQHRPKNRARSIPQSKQRLAQPIVLFLSAKLVAYTLLGFLLGWLGSMLQLTPLMRGMLQIAIGIFMIGTALRMFNVHPIFRLFVFEPPRFLTRYIRRTAKHNTLITPLLLGMLTVLIPCGVTQAMMALAIGTGSPVAGAAIMVAFTLGTSPVFFTLAYVALNLGRRLETRFAQIVGAVVLLLGLLSLETGLNLTGSLSFANLKRDFIPSNGSQTEVSNNTNQVAPSGNNITAPISSNDEQKVSSNTVTITVNQNGYTPNMLYAKAEQPVNLILVTNKTQSCARAFVIPSLNIQQVLPETGATEINLPAQKAGTIQFTCSMGMYQGYIQFQ